MKRFLGVLAILSAMAVPAARAAGVDEFYLARLRVGQDAYRSKRYAEAADELRIASFGFLDQPTLLVETLARLALAQNAAGRKLELQATLTRFLELEGRLTVFGKTKLEPETRAEFDALLKERLTPDQLRAVPSLATLADVAAPSLEGLGPAQKRAAVIELEKKDRGNPAWPLELARLSSAENDPKETIRWASRTLELDADEQDALELRAHAHVQRREWPEALADLKAFPAAAIEKRPGVAADLVVASVAAKDWPAARAAAERLTPELRARADVAQALKKIPAETSATAAPTPTPPLPEPTRPPAAPEATHASRPAPPPAPPVDDTAAAIAAASKLAQEGNAPKALEQLRRLAPKAPQSRELHKAMLEAACLSSDWKTGVEQLASLEPFHDGEEPSMFYAAVSLYETGAAQPAKTLMSRARPRLRSNPFVDHYARKILGSS